jgi:transcriptional regulator with GAF, ATPase, and Fis domain
MQMPTAKKLREEKLSEQLARLLAAIEASGRAVSPRPKDALLQSIVDAAGHIFGAAAASILLVNTQERYLEFKVAYGSSDHDLVGTKFPLDKGLAGYVVMTGQPIAISNVRQDARFNQDFAQSTGYVPTSILATPLLAGEHVIGVMEVLDKLEAVSFNMQDMGLLGLFANQAALAIQQSQQMDQIKDTLVLGLKRLAAVDPAQPLPELMQALQKDLADKQEISDLLALADAFNEISALGEPERRACLQILKTFAEYRRSTRRLHA